MYIFKYFHSITKHKICSKLLLILPSGKLNEVPFHIVANSSQESKNYQNKFYRRSKIDTGQSGGQGADISWPSTGSPKYHPS
jgi:hypothetical protein